MALKNKKSLGQHWLRDRSILAAIADGADITEADTVLEVGPGLGTLTSILLAKAKKVIAVEFDADLARKLPAQFPGKSLEVINEDILTFDLSKLPAGYKVVANVPYYITSKIVQRLTTAQNRPRVISLLVQKEVAERIAAGPGNMSVLAVAAQVFAETSLDIVVPREYFTPPPEVESQVVVLTMRQTPLVDDADRAAFFQLVKAGFGEKRKKLRSSLSGGLRIEKSAADQLLIDAGIDAEARAQELSIEQWKQLLACYRALQ